MTANGRALGVGGGNTNVRTGDKLANLYKCFCEPAPPLMPNALLSAHPFVNQSFCFRLSTVSERKLGSSFAFCSSALCVGKNANVLPNAWIELFVIVQT